MEALRIKANTVPCTALFFLASAYGLFALCMGIVRGTALFLYPALPAPAMGLWWYFRAGYSVTFFPDRLEVRGRFSAEAIPYDGLTAEFRPSAPASAGAAPAPAGPGCACGGTAGWPPAFRERCSPRRTWSGLSGICGLPAFP